MSEPIPIRSRSSSHVDPEEAALNEEVGLAPAHEVAHSSVIELSRSALRKNLEFIQERVGRGVVISSVVKANAYGHGVDPFVPMAERCGIRHFSVASTAEAAMVRQVCSTDSRIMIMGITHTRDLPWVIAHGVEFFVYDLERLAEAAKVAKEQRRLARIHLEVETGGNRTGLPFAELSQAVALLRRHKEHLALEGLCTHFAGIESVANEFRIKKQRANFEATRRKLAAARISPAKCHVGCSAAALAHPDTAMDMVRIGTAQYGFWPSPDVAAIVQSQTGARGGLTRVLSWKTTIMHLKDIARDAFVGYGTAFQAPRDMRIAILPIGYSNGVPRALSNRGQVLVRGRKAPIVGLVNMNVFMVDVSHIPGASVGDEVVLVGIQGNAKISIRSFSELDNVLNNEFVSRLPAAIPRVVVR